MRFAEAVKLLSSSFSIQDTFLGELPENTAVADFNACNNIYRMVVLFLGSLTVSEGDGGSEGVENWRARTEIREDDVLGTQWLATAVRMLVNLKKPFLYTRHGLRSSHEWRLIRHLAGEVCDEMGWTREFHYHDFETLWNELSDGMLDEEIEHARCRFIEWEGDMPTY